MSQADAQRFQKCRKGSRDYELEQSSSHSTIPRSSFQALVDSWRLQEWLPGHAYARTLSQQP